MEKKNKCVRSGFSIILWAVMAIVLCAAPSLRADVTVPAGETWDIDYPVTEILWVYGTANLRPDAAIGWYVSATDTSVVNIHGGTVVMWIDVALGAEVTVYGTGFKLGEGEHFIDYGTVTGFYENGDPINLTFDCQPEATVTLAAPGGDSITVNIEKAKVCWHHSDIHVEGKLYLPQGFWMDNLQPVGSAVITLAGVEVTDQNVDFEITGKKDDKWKYKDEENLYGNIKEFKIDWKYEEGFVKFKLVSAFDSVLFPQGSESLLDELESVISLVSLGDDMISGSDLIGAEKSWTNKDDKHWDYK